jgi:hypothetical protein
MDTQGRVPQTTDLEDTLALAPERNGFDESILDRLRAKRSEHAAQRQLDLEVPGYDGLLALRLRPISGRTLGVLGERRDSSSSPERDFNLNADTLIAACRAVLVRSDRSHSWSVLPDGDGEPVRLDERCAERLGVDARDPNGKPRARLLVKALFSGANAPDLAVARLVGTYGEWATTANEDVDQELLGE